MHARERYAAKWEHFTHLSQTQDSPALERRGFRRWLLLPYIAFVIPIDDPAAVAQLVEWQDAFRDRLHYDPQPPDRLHITLHYTGLLRPAPWFLLPNTWQRAALPHLGERVRPALEELAAFELQIGPLNAFPNVLFAEVHDEHQCVRTLRAVMRRSLPLRARPPSPWPFLPHVTLGLWGKQPARPLVDALRPYRQAAPVAVHVDQVQLTVYTRNTMPLQRDMLSAAEEEIITSYRLKA